MDKAGILFETGLPRMLTTAAFNRGNKQHCLGEKTHLIKGPPP